MREKLKKMYELEKNYCPFPNNDCMDCEQCDVEAEYERRI